jgi:hypothetical protein
MLVLWRRTTCREPTRPTLSSTLTIPTRLISRSLKCSDQTLALLTVLVSGLPDVREGGSAMGNILKFEITKILDKRSSPSGVEYKCELEPMWLAADWVERAQMGRVQIRSYENGLIREECCQTLRGGRRSFQKCKHVERAVFNLCSAPLYGLVYLGTQQHESSIFFLSLTFSEAKFTSGHFPRLIGYFGQKSRREWRRSVRPATWTHHLATLASRYQFH